MKESLRFPEIKRRLVFPCSFNFTAVFQPMGRHRREVSHESIHRGRRGKSITGPGIRSDTELRRGRFSIRHGEKIKVPFSPFLRCCSNNFHLGNCRHARRDNPIFASHSGNPTRTDLERNPAGNGEHARSYLSLYTLPCVSYCPLCEIMACSNVHPGQQS